MASVETVLSELVVGTPDAEIPEEAQRAAARQVLDCVGVTLAGAAQPPGRIIARVTAHLGGAKQARMLGTGLHTSTVQAAWSNGAVAHLLDFDDVGFSHPTACILPAALAVGEEAGVSGHQLVAAMVMGYEVFERLAASGRQDDARLRVRGYHPTSIYGSVAAAAAAGRLLRLDVDQLMIAMSIAASDASGLTQQFGTWGKGLNAGNAARSGVWSALLAREGYWADKEGVSGQFGLFSAVHGEGRYDLSELSRDLGRRWSIVEPGLGLKAYPACGSNRAAIDAMLEIYRRNPQGPEAISRIVVHVHPDVFNTLRYRSPESGFRGKFSLDYTVATAALDGQVAIESFSDGHARRPELRRMLDRVELHEHPEWEMTRRREMPVEVWLNDGTVLSESVTALKGTPARPLSREEVEQKYLDCASCSLPDEQARKSLAAWSALTGSPNVRDLVEVVIGANEPIAV